MQITPTPQAVTAMTVVLRSHPALKDPEVVTPVKVPIGLVTSPGVPLPLPLEGIPLDVGLGIGIT